MNDEETTQDPAKEDPLSPVETLESRIQTLEQRMKYLEDVVFKKEATEQFNSGIQEEETSQ